MFIDPLRTLDVHPPPNWAYDPRTSTLTRLDFRDWRDPVHRTLSVLVVPCSLSVLPPGEDPEWVKAVQAILPPDVLRHETHAGLLLNGRQAVIAETQDATRMAFVLGTRLTASVEEHGSAKGGPLLTPTLLQVIRTMRIAADDDVRQEPTVNWRSAMEAARCSMDSGDVDSAEQHWTRAMQASSADWTSSIRDGDQPNPYAAVGAAQTLLRMAERLVSYSMSTTLLDRATRTLYRCLNSLTTLAPLDENLRKVTHELVNTALDLHVRTEADSRPNNVGEACQLRAVRLQDELTALLDEEDPFGPHFAGVAMSAKSDLATLSYDNAKTAVMLVNSVSGTHFDSLSAAQRSELINAGIRNETAWAELALREEIRALEALASAGRGIALLQLGAVDVSPLAMRRDVLTAARRLTELAPSEDHFAVALEAVTGCVDLLHELGDQASLLDAGALPKDGSDYLAQLKQPGLAQAGFDALVAEHHCLDLDVEPGLEAADRAITAAGAASHQPIEAWARRSRSELLNLSGRHGEALEDARLADVLAPPKQRSRARGRLALALFHAGQSVEASTEIRNAIADEFQTSPVSATMLNHLTAATRLLESCDRELCTRAGDVAELLLEIARSDIGGVDERVALEDALPHRRLVATLVDLRLRNGQVAGALATADRHRGRTLAEQDGNTQRAPGAWVTFAPPPDGATLAELIEATEAAARSAMTGWGIPQPPDESELMRLIEGHGRTVVLFHPTDTKLLAFVVRPGEPPRAIAVAPSADAVLRTTNALGRQLGVVVAARSARRQLPPWPVEASDLELDLDDEELETAEVQLDELRRALHDSLFGSLDNVLDDHEPLAVVPYRELSVVPMALLTRADGTSLADHHALSVLPSIASLKTLGVRQADDRHAVVVGDPRPPSNLGLAPLPGAAKEARYVARLLKAAGTPTTLLLARRATEETLRRVAGGASVVHLACHASTREPASSSALFLTPTTDDEGQLYPDEIANLQLGGALVVLSACESGAGHVTADGVIGLGRAFLRAGARSVLMSLWRVEDEATAFLMKEFYKGLVGKGAGLKGRRLDVADAAKRAQLLTRDRLASRATAWGPWVLVGDGSWHLD